jgi:hypothetical protein
MLVPYWHEEAFYHFQSPGCRILSKLEFSYNFWHESEQGEEEGKNGCGGVEQENEEKGSWETEEVEKKQDKEEDNKLFLFIYFSRNHYENYIHENSC